MGQMGTLCIAHIQLHPNASSNQPQLGRQLGEHTVPESGEDLGQAVFDVVAQFADHLLGVLIEERVQRVAQHFVAVEQIAEVDAHAGHLECHLHVVDVNSLLETYKFVSNAFNYFR